MLFFLSLKLYFWEPYNFPRNTFAYYLKIDNEIKNFPIFSPHTKEKFKVITDDGISPSIAEIAYKTKLKLPHLLLEFKNLGFECKKEISNIYICNKMDKKKRIISVEIIREQHLKITMVFVGF